MRITIEPDDYDDFELVTFDDVRNVAVCGLRTGDGIVPLPVNWYSGNLHFLIGKTYDLLKVMERKLNRIEGKEEGDMNGDS